MSHQPQRTCIGCRSIGDKNNLLRIVKSAEGEIHLDIEGNRSGRGAYLCSDPRCWEKAIQKGALGRSFRCEISEELKNKIWQELTRIEQKDI